MFARVLCVTGRDPHEDAIDEDCENVHRACMSRRLMQVLMSSKKNLDDSFMNQIPETTVDSSQTINGHNNGRSNEIHSNRLVLALHSLNCWNGVNDCERHDWDYDTLVESEISLTSETTSIRELLPSSRTNNSAQAKKEVTWADDEGLDLYLIHKLVPYRLFPVERIEI
jgi:hypothetical protein